jgi:Protein of unknown function (DUF1592)/Protein of unknown function (DUF1588)/Protein of unknown function (DUF1587)/Protein of unknown function (DUF1595)/Protein of unknown function (DUF1585)
MRSSVRPLDPPSAHKQRERPGGLAWLARCKCHPVMPNDVHVRRSRRTNAWRSAALYTLLAAAVACSTGDPASPYAPPPAHGGPDDGTGTSAPGGPAGASDVGTLTVRRLNRAEYDNTVRDLLGETTRFSDTFPPDDGAEGFTNVADALSISPLLVERYEAAAEKLADTAVANPTIITCEPTPATGDACATEILSRFARRAWRRPVSTDEVARLVSVVHAAEATSLPFAAAIQVAIKTTLLSPSFLFRIELDADPTDPKPHALDDYELASRLSYFLWSSMPDDVLFAYAGAKKLSEPRVFDLEVRRMLADPKAKALIDNFASQWLLHTLAGATPDATIFPSFDDGLRASMGLETQAFLGSFLFGDQSLPDMLDARFSFLDARMAAHYGIKGVTSTEPVRVSLPAGSHRGGLLTHASVLTMTAVATRTSPVRRGEWVLSELLCSPPPPPPPGIPALSETISVGTMRERMEAHRKNPVCATCHTQMDPIGFALEHYDAVGRWRNTDQGQPIDASGVLPGGQAIDGATELAAAIKKDPRFERCATRKLYTYALGRVPEPFDAQRLAGLTATFAAGGHRTRDLIVDIVHSDAFRMRHGGK